MISRLSILAHAPTLAQRRFRFPEDESIEPIAPGVAARAAAEIGRWDTAWRAPERRSAETATALGIDAIPHAELRAWSVGVWAGRSVDDVAAQDPAAFATWRTDPDGAPEGGESFRRLLARVGPWVDAHAEERAVVVADPAVIRAAVVYVLGAGHEAFWALDVRPLSLTVIQHANGTARVRAVGIDLDR
jgi:broad specificity phosphatase PhoE